MARLLTFPVSELGDPDARELWLDKAESIILVRMGNEVRAYRNRCPHENKPLNRWPQQFFTLDEKHLLCSWHGAKFAASSGKCIEGPCFGRYLDSIPVTEDNGYFVIDT